ncbi:hypothetical protein GF359_06375 [candidate division WOR-3 bacterium]|uniref:Outer membrane protein beta-barrel domain-containing protein n=1 Tax=candidate division WOR-3 bacterium TaxID=2052148 RepID=A0A9D5K9W6_UNCW3|nr:hypothetical protein [candidate division WOR-3 bacterium]MBD3364824.1 hypothetical protein [candidate division WOR-3 bacterium]
MKKAALVLLAATAIVFAYSNHSFRYLSTGGTLWDNYDWFTTDPARIPTIEGSELYTNLANFVNSAETGLRDTTWMPGSYLIGGKTSGSPLAFAGVADVNMVRTPDPTGIGQDMGYTSTADTSYQVDPSDGSITGRTYSTQTVDAYHTDSDFGGYIGLGYASSETFSLGLAFEHRTDNTFTYAPGDNRTESNYSYDIDNNLTSYDSLYSVGKLGIKQMTNALKFGAWMDRGDLEISAYLGADILTGNSNLDTLYSYDLSDPSGTALTANYNDVVTSWPYFGFSVPLEILGIYEIYEGSELWFSGGAEYSLTSWKDGTGNQSVAVDTSLSDGTVGTISDISIDSAFIDGSGNMSGLSFHAGVKGISEINDKITLGIGAILRGSLDSDSTFREGVNSSFTDYDNGDGIDGVEDYVSTSRYDSSSYVLAKNTMVGLFLPVGVEFRPIEVLGFRLGATFSHQMNTLTSHSQNVGVITEHQHIDFGDGTSTDTTLYRSAYGIGHSEEKQKETVSDVVYDFGIGIKVTENFQLDLMGFTNLLDMSNWRFSAIFKF